MKRYLGLTKAEVLEYANKGRPSPVRAPLDEHEVDDLFAGKPLPVADDVWEAEAKVRFAAGRRVEQALTAVNVAQAELDAARLAQEKLS